MYVLQKIKNKSTAMMESDKLWTFFSNSELNSSFHNHNQKKWWTANPMDYVTDNIDCHVICIQ